MADFEKPQPTPRPVTPPPKVIPQPPPKPRTPPPVSSTSSSSSSSPSSSTTSYSIPYSATDSPFSDHAWFDDRSEGQIDLLDGDQPHTELIMRQVQRLLNQKRQYASITPAAMSFVSPPFSPAGGTHTLSIGEVPPDFPQPTNHTTQDNEHTTPSESDESNNSGKSEGEPPTNTLSQQQLRPKDIKYKRPTQGYVKKKTNGK